MNKLIINVMPRGYDPMTVAFERNEQHIVNQKKAILTKLRSIGVNNMVGGFSVIDDPNNNYPIFGTENYFVINNEPTHLPIIGVSDNLKRGYFLLPDGSIYATGKTEYLIKYNIGKILCTPHSFVSRRTSLSGLKNTLNPKGIMHLRQLIINSYPQFAYINTEYFVSQLEVATSGTGVTFKMHGYMRGRFFHKTQSGILISDDNNLPIKLLPDSIVVRELYSELNVSVQIIAYIKKNYEVELKVFTEDGQTEIH